MTTKKLDALLKQASEKLTKMDFGSAVQLYQQALALAPNNAAAAMGLVMTLNQMGRAKDALPLLQRLWNGAANASGTEATRYKAAVLAQVGVAQQQLGMLDQALQAFSHAYQLLPGPDLERRIEALKVLQKNQDPVQQLIFQGRQFAATGQWDAAGRSYTAALKLHEDHVDALRELAMVQRQRGALDQALPLMQKAIILAPDRADLYNDLGMVFQTRGDVAKAASFYQRALKVDANYLFAHINLGVAYKQMGKNDEAVAAYQAALALQPDSPEAHNNLGNLLRTMGRLDEAKEHLERALALRPDYADAQANLQALLAEQAAQRGTIAVVVSTDQVVSTMVGQTDDVVAVVEVPDPAPATTGGKGSPAKKTPAKPAAKKAAAPASKPKATKTPQAKSAPTAAPVAAVAAPAPVSAPARPAPEVKPSTSKGQASPKAATAPAKKASKPAAKKPVAPAPGR